MEARMMNEFDKRYIEKVLTLHEEMGLDSSDDSEVRIWHLVRSLLEYCDAQHPRIAFELIVEDVRRDFNEAHP
jgi:hypothetical protein